MRKRHKIFADVYDVLIFFVITDYEAEHRGSRQALPSAQKEREWKSVESPFLRQHTTADKHFLRAPLCSWNHSPLWRECHESNVYFYSLCMSIFMSYVCDLCMFIYSEHTMSLERSSSCGKVWHVHCMQSGDEIWTSCGLNPQCSSLFVEEKSDVCLKLSYSTN